MPYVRLIALLTLPALLLGFPSFSSADVTSQPSAPARIEGRKIVRLVALARVEQVKSIANPDSRPAKTPINWLPFTAADLKMIWQIIAVFQATQVPRFAPSLTGIVVLQI
jgi:hypothetical protein